MKSLLDRPPREQRCRTACYFVRFTSTSARVSSTNVQATPDQHKMSKKTSRGAASTASSATKKNQKSSISRSAFSPSYLQVSLFASVVQGFNSQHLRIHDTSTGRLRCEHAAAARARITSLAWGYYGTSYRDNQQGGSKKKRKRDQDAGGHAVVAYGLDTSDICFFSPAEGKIVCTLSGVHERGIKDFQFVVEDQSQGWSIGGDGKLVQWDLTSKSVVQYV
jgi:U3 small nucleolar RNA-associated protein 5